MPANASCIFLGELSQRASLTQRLLELSQNLLGVHSRARVNGMQVLCDLLQKFVDIDIQARHNRGRTCFEMAQDLRDVVFPKAMQSDARALDHGAVELALPLRRPCAFVRDG